MHQDCHCSQVHAFLPNPLLSPPRCAAAQVSHGIRWTCIVYELLLLAKAVTVAVLGEEQVLPPPPECQGAACGRAGLLCLYTSIVAGLLASFAENWLGRRLVAARRKRHEAAEEAASGANAARQPLLAKGKAQQVGPSWLLVSGWWVRLRCSPAGGVERRVAAGVLRLHVLCLNA